MVNVCQVEALLPVWTFLDFDTPYSIRKSYNYRTWTIASPSRSVTSRCNSVRGADLPNWLTWCTATLRS